MTALVLVTFVTFVTFVAAQDAPAEVPGSSDAPPADAPASAPAKVPAAHGEAPLVFDDGAFDDGMSYYNRFEFEKASFRFRAATRSKDKPAAEVARAHLWLGLALGQAGDEVGARDEFIAAIALDQSVVLPADAPPSLRPIFDDARAHPRAAKQATDPLVVDRPSATDAKAVPLATLVGAAVAGGGVLAFAGGAIVGAVAVSQAEAANQERFQDDALAAHEQAASTALVANALLVTGAAASVAGAAVVVAGAFFE